MLTLRMDWTEWTIKELSTFIDYTGKHPHEWLSRAGKEAEAADGPEVTGEYVNTVSRDPLFLSGMAWVALHLDDSTITFDAAADSVSPSEIYAALAAANAERKADASEGEEEAAPPTKRTRTPKS